MASKTQETDFTAEARRNDHGHDNGAVDVRPEEAAPVTQSKAAATVRAMGPDLLRGFLMVVMALDHIGVAMGAMEHGQGRSTEMDGIIVKEWNHARGYTVRTFTHLCAPGFTFLLGMGVIYFGRSRSKLGWSAMRMIRHFAIRAAVLTIITVLMGVVFTAGHFWFLNAVLFALAIDYFLAGLLWLVISTTEPMLAEALVTRLPDSAEDDDDDASRPLLSARTEEQGGHSKEKKVAKALSISWHLHNLLLLVICLVTMWWNKWLSADHGHCSPSSSDLDPSELAHNPGLRIWFYVVMSKRVISVFPPLAWLSPAIAGMLYGRVLSIGKWRPAAIRWGTLAASMAFGFLFVFTRLFQFGNLSEDCLQTDEHLAHPERNQYLVSPQSFFFLIKYPPDVAFFAYTMSVNLLILFVFDSIPVDVAKRFTILLTYGRSALFFYLVHQVVAFGGGQLLVHWFGHRVDGRDELTGGPKKGVDNVWAYWGAWVAVLVILYPLCKWFSQFKQRKGPDSIWRFF